MARVFVLGADAGPGLALTTDEVGRALVAIGWAQSIGRNERALLMHTLGNMVASGELARAGTRRVAGVKRPVPVYALPDQAEPPQGLAQALRGWTT